MTEAMQVVERLEAAAEGRRYGVTSDLLNEAATLIRTLVEREKKLEAFVSELHQLWERAEDECDARKSYVEENIQVEVNRYCENSAETPADLSDFVIEVGRRAGKTLKALERP